MKAIRYIIFIPLIILVVAFLYTLLPLSLFALLKLSRIWLILFLMLFGGLSVAVYTLLPIFVTWLSAKISPSKSFAFYSTLIVSVILGIFQIYGLWVNPDIAESGYGVFVAVLLTCLTIGFAITLSAGAGMEPFQEKETSFDIALIIGATVFYIGIFLVFCLLSIRLCVISDSKVYTWYSGIWHGIFVLPRWVVSWFVDGIFCKAPNATLAYSIWWWISFVIFGLGVLGRVNRHREIN